MKFKFLLFFFLFNAGLSFCQQPDFSRNIHIHIWSELDAYPELKEAQDVSASAFEYPVSRIKETAPFLINGMIYGWNFDYVPYDKARRVDEFFEFSPVQNLTEADKSNIKYAKPWGDETRLNVWIEFVRNPSQLAFYKSWQTIKNPRIKGTGYAKLSEGFEGIQKAAAEALKEAVRNYERQLIKTKPKEITGRVLMTEPPQIGVDAGQYKVTLEFFMETDRIIEYKTF